MIYRPNHHSPTLRLAAVSALLAGTIGLGGCAVVGDSAASLAFVDPARFDLYDCKRLAAERKSMAVRTAELNGLIAKAQTGVGGSVVAELAYRNDYIAVRGQARLADEAWRNNKCTDAGTTAAPAAASAAAPAPKPPAANAPPRSGSAVY